MVGFAIDRRISNVHPCPDGTEEAANWISGPGEVRSEASVLKNHFRGIAEEINAPQFVTLRDQLTAIPISALGSQFKIRDGFGYRIELPSQHPLPLLSIGISFAFRCSSAYRIVHLRKSKSCEPRSQPQVEGRRSARKRPRGNLVAALTPMGVVEANRPYTARMRSLKDMVVIITGASAGIGRALAVELAG